MKHKMTFSEYLKRSKGIEEGSKKPLKVAFASNFTIDGLGEICKVKSAEMNVFLQTKNLDYGQYAQNILDGNSELYKFDPGLTFLMLDIENYFGEMLEFPYRLKEDGRKKLVEDSFEELKGLILKFLQTSNSKLVVNSFLVPINSSRGILEEKEDFGIKESIAYFNKLLFDLSKKEKNLFVYDINNFYSKHGRQNIVDNRLYYIADMKISTNYLIELADEYLTYILPAVSSIRKCLVLDLDETLWGGILGEAGIEGIKLGKDKEGKPYLDFQKRILELHERGIILAINSKNNEEDVKGVLEKHSDMILKEKHFAAIRANWNDKATNIVELAKELNIGTDSMVFIDDDPRNRQLVRETLPEVYVPEVPEDPVGYKDLINNMKVFDTFSLTEEDMKRGELYQNQKQRNQLKTSTKDLDSFLKSLGTKVVLEAATDITVPRISQLTQRTNQFNLTTRRYSEEDINKMKDDESSLVYGVNISDKFGDNGLCGVFIVKKSDAEWKIDTFLLSCRVLGRKIEQAILGEIIKMAQSETQKLVGEFIASNKNMQTKDFYSENRFSKRDENTYVLEELKAKPIDFIKIEKK